MALPRGSSKRTKVSDTLFGVRKEKSNGGSNIIRRSLTKNAYVNRQALLLATATRTAEVAGLKRDLGRAKEELSLVKRQLEENKGTQYPICIFIKKKLLVLIGAS